MWILPLFMYLFIRSISLLLKITYFSFLLSIIRYQLFKISKKKKKSPPSISVTRCTQFKALIWMVFCMQNYTFYYTYFELPMKIPIHRWDKVMWVQVRYICFIIVYVQEIYKRISVSRPVILSRCTCKIVIVTRSALPQIYDF